MKFYAATSLLKYFLVLWLLAGFACNQKISKQDDSKTSNGSSEQSLAPEPSNITTDSTTASSKTGSSEPRTSTSSSKITYTIISSEQNTFGYDIYMEGKLVIHQPSIPGLPGNKGFNTEEEAIKVAQLVIGKIENGEMPPTISTEELKNLGIEVK